MPGRYRQPYKTVARRRGAQFKKRPYVARVNRSLYDNDAWIKVQRSVAIRFTNNLGGNAWAGYVQMRTDLATSTAVDNTWID